MMRTPSILLLLAACAAPTGSAIPEALLDPAPLSGTGATITVLGLSCPNCATNVDLKLKQLPAVSGVQVDLGTGVVDVAFGEGAKPSRRDLATAIRDSGFTVVAITSKP
jgi:copper chaperone CopZ